MTEPTSSLSLSPGLNLGPSPTTLLREMEVVNPKPKGRTGNIAKEQIYLHPRPIFVTREDFTSIEVFLLKFIVQKN